MAKLWHFLFCGSIERNSSIALCVSNPKPRCHPPSLCLGSSYSIAKAFIPYMRNIGHKTHRIPRCIVVLLYLVIVGCAHRLARQLREHPQQQDEQVAPGYIAQEGGCGSSSLWLLLLLWRGCCSCCCWPEVAPRWCCEWFAHCGGPWRCLA